MTPKFGDSKVNSLNIKKYTSISTIYLEKEKISGTKKGLIFFIFFYIKSISKYLKKNINVFFNTLLVQW